MKLLERVKHFFSVDGICFVIATDEKNLPQAVKTLYGQDVDGELYLRKFFDFEFNLPPASLTEHSNYLFSVFPGTDPSVDAGPLRKRLLEDPQISSYSDLLDDSPERLDQAEYCIYFGHIANAFGMQLRDAQQAHTLLMAFVRSYPADKIRLPFIDCYISCLRFKDPDHYRSLVTHRGAGVSRRLRQGEGGVMNSIPAITTFSSISDNTIAHDFRQNLAHAIHTSNAPRSVQQLSNISLLLRSLTSVKGARNPQFRMQPDAYIDGVLGLTAAFTDLGDR